MVAKIRPLTILPVSVELFQKIFIIELCVIGTGIDEEDVVSKEQKTIDGKTVRVVKTILYNTGNVHYSI